MEINTYSLKMLLIESIPTDIIYMTYIIMRALDQLEIIYLIGHFYFCSISKEIYSLDKSSNLTQFQN